MRPNMTPKRNPKWNWNLKETRENPYSKQSLNKHERNTKQIPNKHKNTIYKKIKDSRKKPEEALNEPKGSGVKEA